MPTAYVFDEVLTRCWCWWTVLQ